MKNYIRNYIKILPEVRGGARRAEGSVLMYKQLNASVFRELSPRIPCLHWGIIEPCVRTGLWGMRLSYSVGAVGSAGVSGVVPASSFF